MKNLITIILVVLSLLGCMNNGNLPGRVDVVTSGTAKAEFTVTLGFLDQLKTLCEDYVASYTYPTVADRNHAVSECVFNNLKDLGKTATVTDFQNQFCSGEDLSSYSEQEVLAIQQMCSTLGY